MRPLIDVVNRLGISGNNIPPKPFLESSVRILKTVETMKTLTILLLLISSACFGQVTPNEVYEKLGYAPKTDIQLTKESSSFSSKILEELGLFGEFKMPHSKLGKLTAYTGPREDVLKLIDSDKNFYKEAKSIFTYSDYDYSTNWTVVLVYILPK